MLDFTINLKVNEGKEAAVIPPVEESGEPHVVVDNDALLVSERLQRAIEHCRLVDKENLDVSQLELRIKSEGYGSFNELATDLGDTMRRVGSAKIGE